jgi:hypothetical protein
LFNNKFYPAKPYVFLLNFTSSGSVVAEVSVYTSPQYTGTITDLEGYFKSGLNNTNGKSYLQDLEIKNGTVTGICVISLLSYTFV